MLMFDFTEQLFRPVQAENLDERLIDRNEAAISVFYEITDVVQMLEKAEPVRGRGGRGGFGGGAAPTDAAGMAGERRSHTEPQSATASCKDW